MRNPPKQKSVNISGSRNRRQVRAILAPGNREKLRQNYFTPKREFLTEVEASFKEDFYENL